VPLPGSRRPLPDLPESVSEASSPVILPHLDLSEEAGVEGDDDNEDDDSGVGGLESPILSLQSAQSVDFRGARTDSGFKATRIAYKDAYGNGILADGSSDDSDSDDDDESPGSLSTFDSPRLTLSAATGARVPLSHGQPEVMSLSAFAGMDGSGSSSKPATSGPMQSMKSPAVDPSVRRMLSDKLIPTKLKGTMTSLFSRATSSVTGNK
jgi:hypothetical protein